MFVLYILIFGSYDLSECNAVQCAFSGSPPSVLLMIYVML